jgi:alpha-tubulin suppressor-like RCC1 family protein
MFEEVASPASAPIYTPRALDPGTAIAVGDNFTCAVADGAPRCWGINTAGQLGADSAAASSGPLAVVTAAGPLAEIAGIDSAVGYGCASGAGGAWCWGDNTNGRLGDGTTESRGVAAPVLLPAGAVRDLRAGGTFACAIVDADILCWGANDVGQLSRPVEPFDPTPTPIGGNPREPLQLGAGADHACVREGNGEVWCWGSNAVGKLGPPAGGGFSAQAVRPLGDTVVVDLAVGSHHSCARTDDNRVLCWGAGALGRLGGEKPTPDAVVRARIACGAS